MKFNYNKITKFIFKKCWVHQKINNLKDKNMLGYYLAGLIEGDGSIIVPKKERNEKGKLLYPKFKITFVEKDSPLAIKIQEIIGAGTLEYPKNTKYVNLLFQDLNSLQRIAVLLNGKMRTPKIEALFRLIDWLNAKLNTSKVLVSSKKILKLELDNSPLGNNPWLSGFIEADGNFYSTFDLNSEGLAKSIRHYMRISQKTVYNKNLNISIENNTNFIIMEQIREFLNVKSLTKINRTKKNYIELAFEVRTTRKNSSDKLINYLSKFPLFSSKQQDFLAWSEIHKIRLSKTYKTKEGTSKLIYLKNSMNTLRTQFNWDSLDKIYTK